MTNAGLPVRPKFRLYVDEVGHATIKAGAADNDRYLGLIGVACNLATIKTTIKPQMETVKRFFVREVQDPDEAARPIIFHRKELAERKYPFEALRDDAAREIFDEELLRHLAEWDYTVFSVVIDKQELHRRYQSPAHPYHYGMEMLLERYVRWLEMQASVGDVLAEARGGKEDQLLEAHYQTLYQRGTGYVSTETMASHLTSRELELKQKQENTAGLQLAEFLIRPCYYAALALKEGKPLPSNFGGQIEKIVQQKYYRNASGRVEGYGCKWLP